jgi:hypothetical protein
MDGDEAVDAGEFVGQVAPGEDEKAAWGESGGGGGEEVAGGIGLGEVGEGVAHADNDGGLRGADVVEEGEHVGIVGLDVGMGVGAEGGFEFGEELGAGIDGDDRGEAQVGEGEGLESWTGAEVDSEAARDVVQERFENCALFSYFFVEGETEHPGIVVGEEVAVVVLRGGHLGRL